MLATLCCASPAWAIRRDAIPEDLKRRLPEFLLTIIDPRALAALSLKDLQDYAAAYEKGELRFIDECRIEESSGPLSPDQAMAVLQCMPGAPWIERRFRDQVTWAYGRGIFSSVSWVADRNSDGSVDLRLWYHSRDPSFISPELGYGDLSGVQYGATYQDLYFGGQDKQLRAGLQLNADDFLEPRVFGSWTDNTLREGQDILNLSASVGNSWRTRLTGHPNRAQIRDRVARIDGAYSRGGAPRLDDRYTRLRYSAGLYQQDDFVRSGDPTKGNPPRSDFSEDGTAAYFGLGLVSSSADELFTPQEGWSYVLNLRQNVGDFPFSEAQVDLRRYQPARNLLGLHSVDELQYGEKYSVQELLPAASFAWQLQADLQDGDVPYTEELIPGGTLAARGYSYNRYAGTKLLAARAEYRMRLDKLGENEAFFFTDHAFIGERMEKLEALDSFGLGGIFTLPVYGGVKVGAYYGRAFNSEDSNYGLTFGYQF